MSAAPPGPLRQEVDQRMNTPRRIAAAFLTAALSLGIIGVVAGPAEARTDTTWPDRVILNSN